MAFVAGYVDCGSDSRFGYGVPPIRDLVPLMVLMKLAQKVLLNVILTFYLMRSQPFNVSFYRANDSESSSSFLKALPMATQILVAFFMVTPCTASKDL